MQIRNIVLAKIRDVEMDIKDFISGSQKQQYQYKSFMLPPAAALRARKPIWRKPFRKLPIRPLFNTFQDVIA